MKKTLATLLILALVASVCGAMFASATDPVEELKAELEALVGPDAADAEFDWVFDVETDKAGLVTVTLTVDNVNDKNVTFVSGFFYYNVNELTLLNDVDEDSGLIDCITSMPADFENLSVTYAEKGAEGFEPVPGVLVMNVANLGNDSVLSADEPLEITLKFQMADGVNLAGMYIPTDSVEGASLFDPILGNGAYGIAIREVDEPTTSDPVSPDDSSEDTSSEDTSSEDTSSEDTSSEDTSSEDTSSEDTSSEDTSSEDTSSEDTSSEDTSSEETSSEDTSSEDTSSEDTSSEDTSSEDTSSEDSSSEAPVTSSEDTSSEPPKPGDAGVTLFVILGVLALAGAAVAIKVRN